MNNNVYLYNLTNNAIIAELDIAFPLIHGPTGEDGVIQGFLSALNCHTLAPLSCLLQFVWIK